jgi:hypothetical protein
MPVTEDMPTRPPSPYASSKLMSEIMLHDSAAAHALNYVVLRYFNVAGADPQAQIGLATVGATHLLKIAVEAATGQRAKIDVFGTDYPTPDEVIDWYGKGKPLRAGGIGLRRWRAGPARVIRTACVLKPFPTSRIFRVWPDNASERRVPRMTASRHKGSLT